MMFDEHGQLVYPQWDNEEQNDRKEMYQDFYSLYQIYLGRELVSAEKSILNQAIRLCFGVFTKKHSA
jgi:hypothetical protein